MLDRRLRKLGTLLGLLAIWLTALAPAISQTLAAQHHSARAPMVEACPEHAGTGGHANAGHLPAQHSHYALGHLQACAYCGFFAHFPVLPGVAPALVPAFTQAAASYAEAASELPRTTRFLSAQPRAPPVVS